MHNVAYGPGMHVLTVDELGRRLRSAARADLDVFKRTDKWPLSDVALSLEVDALGRTLETAALGVALATLDDLVIIASPGTGKTAALFQVAEASLIADAATPLIVPLADWSTGTHDILGAVLRRPAFTGITEADFRKVATSPGVALILDGWNELDSKARLRASSEIARLRAELPELTLLISTRRQSLDVPFPGQHVSVLPLNEAQQMAIALALRGERGARILDEAWRSPGVRELVTLPLYLTALLQLREDQPFPTTKEEILRRFVAMHEGNAQRAEIFRTTIQECQSQFLGGLAVIATTGANTAISETSARKSVVETDSLLIADGLISFGLQPLTVLDTLVSHHVLIRSMEPVGYSFQHQQFQEWYASRAVECEMLAAVTDPIKLAALKAKVLDAREWEEPVLFATERMSRGDASQQKACGVAIMAAFDVDPILAAEMIFRATEAVWADVGPSIQAQVRRWHSPGKIDRSLHFIVASGRPEFGDLVWPLVTDENDQKSLAALRAARRFRPSVLGEDVAERIRALPSAVRKTVLHEIAARSGMDGLDLATNIARQDADPEVQATVVDALAFRRADRHVVEILSTASNKTFDLVHHRGMLDEIDDVKVTKGVSKARKRAERKGMSVFDRLHSMIFSSQRDPDGEELAALIETMDVGRDERSEIALIYDAQKRNPSAIADGLLRRVRAGSDLFYGADDLLAVSGMILEDADLLEVALASENRRDSRAEAAASVLGPVAVSKMIDAMLEVKRQVRMGNGAHDKAASDRYFTVRDRIARAPISSIVSAMNARVDLADSEEISELADLLARRRRDDDEHARNTDEISRDQAVELARTFGERLLATGEAASRRQLASFAHLVTHAPSLSLLPLLQRVLDEELRRYRGFHERVAKFGRDDDEALNESRSLTATSFQNAFTAIRDHQTTSVMMRYLSDEHFGGTAAIVLKVQWIDANEPKEEQKFFRFGIDFSSVEAKRLARAGDRTATSPEAEAMFSAIDQLTADGTTDDQHKLAVKLTIQAARLPHGDRPGTIAKLLALAHHTSRASIFLNLLLSGETISFEEVKRGVAEVLEEAKQRTWILTEGGYQLKEWLRLLPFTDEPGRMMEIIDLLPDRQRTPDFLEEMIQASQAAPSVEVEEALFQLAEANDGFYENRSWREAILRRNSATSAHRYIDLVVAGTIKARAHDSWHGAQEIAGLLNAHPGLRAHVYDVLRNSDWAKSDMLVRAVTETADTEGLLLLAELERKIGRAIISWQTVRTAIVAHVPSEHWKGAYDVVPVAAVELRRALLAMTTDGGKTDAAARVLTMIDKMRDEYGAPEDEPRHPDLSSGKPWPIMSPDPDAEDGQ